MIKIEKLCKNYDKLEVLKGIDAQVNKGDIIAIIGPSGSGKSTFLRCINKLEEPTSGHIYIKNQDIMSDNTDINLIRQKVGMVFQHFNLFPHKTVMENLTLAPMKLKNLSQEEAEKKALILLEKVGLKDKASAYPNQLSGGQKQRIAIARALIQNPEILILDEATSALDTESERLVQDALDRLMVNRTTFVIAHRLSTIINADKIVVMENGRIKEVGRHQDLLDKNGLYKHFYDIQFGKEVKQRDEMKI